VDLTRDSYAMILGEAVLVGGVTTLCRCHSLARLSHFEQATRAAFNAMTQFYHAEAILRAVVGPMNEKSIYTLGNLGELLWNQMREYFLSMLHHRQSCIVAANVFGPRHANARRKLNEFGRLLSVQGWNDFADLVESGRPEQLKPSALLERFISIDAPPHGPSIRSIGEELRTFTASDRASAHLRGGFWTELWTQLGVPSRLVSVAGLPN